MNNRHNLQKAKGRTQPKAGETQKHCEDFIILRACSEDGVTKEAMEKKKNGLKKGLKSVDRLCKPVAVYLLVCFEWFSVGMLLSVKWGGCGAFIVKANGKEKVALRDLRSLMVPLKGGIWSYIVKESSPGDHECLRQMKGITN